MRIAITGANGFIGKALCPYLSHALQAEILPITRSGQHNLNLSLPDEVLKEQLQNVDCLIHLASRAHMGKSTAQDFERDNIQLSQRIGTLCIEANIPRLIYVSSIKVNGNSTTGRSAFTADESPSPEDIYGQSKLAAEKLLQKITAGTHTQLVILRPPLVYGDKNKGNLQQLIQWVKWGIPLPFRNFKNRRDIVSIDNVCSLLCLLVQHPKALGEIFLVSDGIARNTAEIVNLLCAKQQRKAIQFPVPFFIFSLLSAIPFLTSKIESLTGSLEVDITKTTSILGWQPK